MKLDTRLSLADGARTDGLLVKIAEACRYCARREHLRRTAGIALAVGLLLTLVNQGEVIISGRATTLTLIRCALNFLIPFFVSNLGLLGGRGRGGGGE